MEGRGVPEAFTQLSSYWQATDVIFSLGVCLLLGYPCSSGWLHNHVHAPALTGFDGLFKEKDTKVGEESIRGTQGSGQGDF